MGNEKAKPKTSRRGFFSSFVNASKPETVKMLSPDGKLVEVNKALLEKLSTGKKATNKEVYEWMQNPSKENQ